MSNISSFDRNFLVGLAPSLRGPYARVVLADGELPDLLTPFSATVSAGSKSTDVIVYRFSDLGDDLLSENERIKLDSGGVILLGARLFEYLNLHDDQEVKLFVNETHILSAVFTDVFDLPDVAEVHTSTLKAGWYFMTIAGLLVPVRVRVRATVQAGKVRIDRTLRLLGSSSQTPSSMNIDNLNSAVTTLDARILQFSPISPSGGLLRRTYRNQSGNQRTVRELLLHVPIRVGHTLIEALEICLRFALKAPKFAVRIRQAVAGDDYGDVIRMTQTALEMLGVESGDIVEVRWGRRVSLAKVLKTVESSAAEMEFVSSQPAVEGTSNIPLGLPQHLVATISATVRRDLGCGANTVVIVRRRLTSTIRRHGAAVSLSLVGAIFATAEFRQNVRGLLITVLIWVVLLSALLWQVRIPKAPRGLWP